MRRVGGEFGGANSVDQQDRAEADSGGSGGGVLRLAAGGAAGFGAGVGAVVGAAAGGLRVDDFIASLDDQPVQGPDDFEARIANGPAGGRLPLPSLAPASSRSPWEPP